MLSPRTIIYFVAILLLITSCSRSIEKQLLGEWKPLKIEEINVGTNELIETITTLKDTNNRYCFNETESNVTIYNLLRGLTTK